MDIESNIVDFTERKSLIKQKSSDTVDSDSIQQSGVVLVSYDPMAGRGYVEIISNDGTSIYQIFPTKLRAVNKFPDSKINEI